MLSEHFERWEFTCRCGCGFDTVDAELIAVLEDLRAELGSMPITITSGCRCLAHNMQEGGSPDSMHLRCKAADIVHYEVSASGVAEFLEDSYPGKYGIGRYDDRTHIDVREGCARWNRCS